MRTIERKRLRKSLDLEMRSYRRAGMTRDPTQGLLKAIRECLSIPVAEIVEKARMNRSGVYDFESREMKRTITLRSMAKLAGAMGCKVVYGIVPKGGKTLESLSEERFWAMARIEQETGDVRGQGIELGDLGMGMNGRRDGVSDGEDGETNPQKGESEKGFGERNVHEGA